MIICTPHTLSIGERRQSMMSRNETDGWHQMPYIVLRVATREEWRQGCIDDGLDITVEPASDYNFYEISID